MGRCNAGERARVCMSACAHACTRAQEKGEYQEEMVIKFQRKFFKSSLELSSSQGSSASGPPQPRQPGYPARANSKICLITESNDDWMGGGIHNSSIAGGDWEILPPNSPIVSKMISFPSITRKSTPNWRLGATSEIWTAKLGTISNSFGWRMITPRDRSTRRASSRCERVRSTEDMTLRPHASLEGCLLRRTQDGSAIRLGRTSCDAIH